MHPASIQATRRALAFAVLISASSLVAAQTPPVAATPAAAAPAAATAPAAAPAAAPAEPVADEASSYAVGMTFGLQLKSGGIDHAVSMDALVQGMKDAIAGKAFSDEDRERALKLVRTGRDALTDHNRKAARDFLAQNRTVGGVVTTDSGLQYTIFAAGDAKAATPSAADRVTVNYRGRLLDGTEFDNSDKHKQAATFTVGSVLKGWKEALLLMKPGAKWRLFVPPELAYDAYSPPSIPPGSLLIFDIELVKIEGAPVMGPMPRKSPAAGKGAAPVHHKVEAATPPAPAN